MIEIIGETVVKRLIAWGVDRVYESPGEGMRGVLEGLRRHPDEIQPVEVENEAAAADQARAHAWQSGGLGVCLACGGLQMSSGLYDAMLQHTPVLAITGVPAGPAGSERSAEAGHPPDRDHPLLDVLPGCSFVVTASAQVPSAVDLVIGRALAERTVSHLAIPDDIQVSALVAEPARNPHWDAAIDSRRQ